MKKKTIYIHIGSPKTGTTSIQQFLTVNSKILLKEGLSYPLTGRQYTRDDMLSSQGKLNNGLVSNNSKNRLSSDKKKSIICVNGSMLANYGYDEDRIEETIKNFSNSKNTSLVLSDEVLFIENKNNICDKSYAWDLLSKFEVKIIVYLRKSAEYLCSLWQEELKDKSTIDLDSYLKSHPYQECLQIIHDLSKKVGKKNIIVRPFEKEAWINNDLIDDFLSIFKIKKSDQFEDLKEINNISFKRSRSEKFRYINQYIDISIGQNNYNILKKIPEEQDDKKIIDSISDENIKKISDKYYPDECKIAEEFLRKKKLFADRYPKIYKAKRDKYINHISKEDKEELRFIINSILQQQSINNQNTLIRLEQQIVQKDFAFMQQGHKNTQYFCLFRLKKIAVLFLCALIPSKEYRANIRKYFLEQEVIDE